MSEKKIIAIVGATGNQGGSLLRKIVSVRHGGFSPRALTRDPNSERAKTLEALGAEVVYADADTPESLVKAFTGAYGAYCVTNFWEHMSGERETEQAVNLARAAKEAGVKHVIWSTFEDTRKRVPLNDERMPTLGGKYKVPHFDAKADADQAFVDPDLRVTFLKTAYYWESLLAPGEGPQKQPDGRYALTLPMGDQKLSGMSYEDIGKCAYGIFKEGRTYFGKYVGIAGEHLTITKMASILTQVLGKQFYYNEVTPDAFRAFGFPAADELGNMYQYKHDFNKEYCAARDLSLARRLNPELKTFEHWVREHKDDFPF